MTNNDIKGKYFPVLDKGFCGVVDYMGTDHDIAEAARCSYGKGTKKISDDEQLIRHLMRNEHTSPFEMCELKLHIGCPIFTWRQWIRTRTASVNEFSGRYSVLPNIFYEPDDSRYQKQSSTNKQGSSPAQIDEDERVSLQKLSREMRADMVAAYEANLKCDVARELARIDLPLSIYTYAYWKIDLHNLLRFLRLRLDEHAQWEIRQYAQVIAGIVKELWPITWKAFSDYTLNSVKFSFAEQLVLCDIVNDPSLSLTLQHQSEKDMVVDACVDAGMGKTEIGEFMSKIRKMSLLVDFDKIFPEGHGELYTLDIANAKTAEHFKNMVENA